MSRPFGPLSAGTLVVMDGGRAWKLTICFTFWLNTRRPMTGNGTELGHQNSYEIPLSDRENWVLEMNVFIVHRK